MIKLGVTGSIATGKTLVESFLKDEGIATIDADEIVHDLLASDKAVIKKVHDLFIPLGVNVLDEKGGISRQKVGKIVFENREKLRELESILHPRVQRKIEDFFDNNSNKDIVAAVIPLLFETNMEIMFDYTLLVTANEKVQLERLIKRSKCTEVEVNNRINAQMPQKEKIKKADFIIDNSYDPEITRKQVLNVLEKLKN